MKEKSLAKRLLGRLWLPFCAACLFFFAIAVLPVTTSSGVSKFIETEQYTRLFWNDSLYREAVLKTFVWPFCILLLAGLLVAGAVSFLLHKRHETKNRSFRFYTGLCLAATGVNIFGGVAYFAVAAGLSPFSLTGLLYIQYLLVSVSFAMLLCYFISLFAVLRSRKTTSQPSV